MCAGMVAALWAQDLARAADVLIHSGPARASLLELYTSEGCSSCPPAEDWLSRLTTDARLWKDVVPVAFHVTYWNHQNWADPFADEAFDAREREYGKRWPLDGVYTPCFALNGREWKAWRKGVDLPEPAPGDAGRLVVVCREGGDVEILFTPSGAVVPPVRAHLCVLGFGLTSNVTGGENKGRTLAHDFVVREKQDVACQPGGLAYRGHATIHPSQGRAALAVWMVGKDDPTPLQAAGGWLLDQKNVRSTSQ